MSDTNDTYTTLASIDRVHPHGGTCLGYKQVQVGQLFHYDPGGDVLLFLEGPADADPPGGGPPEPGALTWDVQAEYIDPDDKKKVEVKFVRTREAASGLFRTFKIPTPGWPACLGTNPKPPKRFLAAELPTRATLKFVFTLNANDERVVRAGAARTEYEQLKAKRGEDDHQTRQAKKAAIEAIKTACPSLLVSAFKRQTKESYEYRGADGLGQLKVKPVPLCPLPGYKGYVAIDLGNTGSMLAFIPENDQRGEIRLLRQRAKPSRDAVPTAVWIMNFAPAPAAAKGEDPEMPKATWEFAWDAAGGPDDVLVLGAKRLLSDPSRGPDGQVYRVHLNDKEARIPKRLPAELFLCKLLQTFHEEVEGGPCQIAAPRREWWEKVPEGGSEASPDKEPVAPTGGMAVTYPTTFSVREIANLRRAAYTGWRRALGQTRYAYKDADIDRVIALLIDEASAAALYFIYRDFLTGAGRARWLRYLYPRGMNVLVYDCGGGTTDIALIRVHAEYRGGDEDRASQVHIRVIGRTGHRGFGGDDITKAVFALIKAKVAAALPKGKGLNLPTDPAALAAFLEKPANADRINELFPTYFARSNLYDRGTRDRAAAVLELWHEAEYVKTQFTTDPAGKVKVHLSGAKGGEHVGKYYSVHLKLTEEQVGAIVNRVEVSRAEVDAVIAARVAATVERANGLIRRRLGPDRPGADPADPGDDVHKVYLLGNASRYPLVRQQLEEYLEAPFLATPPTPTGAGLTRRLVFDEDNLKGAVAKGAVAALLMRKEHHGAEVFFDDSLKDRLPYHICYADIGRGVQVLFRESEPYDALAPTVIPRPDFRDQKPGETGRTVYLQREWPDDGRREPYLTFVFANEIKGDLTVEYQPEAGGKPPRFIMSDPDSGQLQVEGVEVKEAEYVSPPQSGLL